MSTIDNKKHKRRKLKKTSKQDLPDQTVKNLSHLYNIQIEMPNVKPDDMHVQTLLNSAKDTARINEPGNTAICRGSNPYLGGQQCLLCRCERTDPIKHTLDPTDMVADSSSLPQLPLWVCASCQKSMEDVEKLTKLDTSSLTKCVTDSDDQEFTVESRALQMMAESRLSSVSESTVQSTPNTCHCSACSERRLIEADYQKETHELQKNWSELRRYIWRIYRESDPDCAPDPDDQQHHSDPDVIRELIHKLCRCDPHQLYRRLESQTREYILGKKVKLLRLLTTGHPTPMETRTFIKKLLSVYHYLCVAASKLSVLFKQLEEEHLKGFKVTWELHDKHMFQSIVYMDPLIQNSLQSLINHLRQGATSEEKGEDESYSSVLRQYIKFDNEMSVVCVVWRECHQYIEAYNDEQAALKVKQKMVKEDWEFFKQQRRLLEQVSKNSKLPKSPQSSVPTSVVCTNNNSTSSTCTAGLEARFTETMRHILQGSKNPQDERQCPRCSQKSCPCDECTITHMITCGIISPESVETSSSHHMPPPFMHDPAQYIIDVTPPSMSTSGSTSSSGSSSPMMIERLAPPFDDYADTFQSCEEVADDDSQSGDDTTTDSKFADAETPRSPDSSDSPLPPDIGADSPDRIPVVPASVSVQNWVEASAKVERAGSGADAKACDCHHCITQTLSLSPSKTKALEQCQCHVCLQQQGLVSTALPHDMPAMTRPSEFHLYPHIHGHHVSAPDNHHPSLLHPHLYDLHVPPKVASTAPVSSSAGSKVQVKLDFDTPEGIQEHMYHAYSEWENTRMLLGAPTSPQHAFPPKPVNNNVVDLLPPPDGAFTNEALQSFARDQSLLNKLTSLSNRVLPDLIKGTDDGDAALLYSTQQSMSHVLAPPPPSQPVSSHVACHKSPALNMSKNASPQPSSLSMAKCMMDHSHGAASNHPQAFCGTRPPPIGGNVMQQKMNIAAATPHDKVHCKHNVVSPSTGPPPHHNHINNNATTNQPSKLPRPLTRQNAPVNNFAAAHTCSHMRNNNVPPSASANYPHTPSQCVNNAPVSSSLYPDIDCNGHPDDDSLDDSCSEKSSSTSTSNQKDGKYCDCCYCEFFGHSNPPSLPTSKNYAEMRDRLRQRLKRKNEMKDGGGADVVKDPVVPPQRSGSGCTDDGVIVVKSSEYLGDRGLDELIQYINGLDEPKAKVATATTSSKSAKRARQKQRKAEKKKGPENSYDKEDESNVCYLSTEKTRNDKESSADNDAENVETSDTKQRKMKNKKDQAVKTKCDLPNNLLSDEMKIVTEKNLKNHQLVKDVKVVDASKKVPRLELKAKIKPMAPVSQKSDEGLFESKREKSKESFDERTNLAEDSRCINVKQTLKQHTQVTKNSLVQSPQVRRSPPQQSHVLVNGSVDNSKFDDMKRLHLPQQPRPSAVEGKRDLFTQSKSSVGDMRKNEGTQLKSNIKVDNSKSNAKVDSSQQQKANVHPKVEALQQAKPSSKFDAAQQQKVKPAVGKSNVVDGKRVEEVQPTKPSANEGKKLEKTKSLKDTIPKVNLPDLWSTKNDKASKTAQANNCNGKLTKPASLPNGIVMIESPKNARKKDKKLANNNNGTLIDKSKPEPSKVEPVKLDLNKVDTSKSVSHVVIDTQSIAGQTAKNSPVVNSSTKSSVVVSASGKAASNGRSSVVTTRPQPVVTQAGVRSQPVVSLLGNKSPSLVSLIVKNSMPPSPRNGQTSVTASRTNAVTVKPADCATSEGIKSILQLSPRSHEIVKAQNKNKRRNRKSKNQEDLPSVDEIFMPKTDSDLEGGEMDDVERELEEFKRFCFDCKPSAEDRVQVNVNLKDIFNKKKAGLGCS